MWMEFYLKHGMIGNMIVGTTRLKHTINTSD
jgi:hypothetical protein